MKPLAILAAALCAGACHHSAYAVRPVPRIVAESVGEPVSRLQDAFGNPRKIDPATNKQLYVWFLPQSPSGAPQGLHGCELEVTVDARSQRVLGYSLSNIGWADCREIQRKIRVASR